GAMRKLGMLPQKDLRGNGDAGLLARHDRIGSLFLSFPALHFDKCQVIPALGFVAVSKNPVILAFEEPARAALSRHAGCIGGRSWEPLAISRGHRSCPSIATPSCTPSFAQLQVPSRLLQQPPSSSPAALRFAGLFRYRH